jgi:hypothetical protein
VAQQELLSVDRDRRRQVGRSQIRLRRRRIPAPAICNGRLSHICPPSLDRPPLAAQLFDLLDRDIGGLTVVSKVPAARPSFSNVIFLCPDVDHRLVMSLADLLDLLNLIGFLDSKIEPLLPTPFPPEL